MTKKSTLKAVSEAIQEELDGQPMPELEAEAEGTDTVSASDIETIEGGTSDLDDVIPETPADQGGNFSAIATPLAPFETPKKYPDWMVARSLDALKLSVADTVRQNADLVSRVENTLTGKLCLCAASYACLIADGMMVDHRVKGTIKITMDADPSKAYKQLYAFFTSAFRAKRGDEYVIPGGNVKSPVVNALLGRAIKAGLLVQKGICSVGRYTPGSKVGKWTRAADDAKHYVELIECPHNIYRPKLISTTKKGEREVLDNTDTSPRPLSLDMLQHVYRHHIVKHPDCFSDGLKTVPVLDKEGYLSIHVERKKKDISHTAGSAGKVAMLTEDEVANVTAGAFAENVSLLPALYDAHKATLANDNNVTIDLVRACIAALSNATFDNLSEADKAMINDLYTVISTVADRLNLAD